jgi:hypothetical protein
LTWRSTAQHPTAFIDATIAHYGTLGVLVNNDGMRRATQHIPLQTDGSARDIVKAVRFLAAAQFITRDFARCWWSLAPQMTVVAMRYVRFTTASIF